MKKLIVMIFAVALLGVAACKQQEGVVGESAVDPGPALDAIAEKYVKLSLSMGKYDRDFVDAYYGPEEWKQEVDTAATPFDSIHPEAEALLEQVKSISGGDEMQKLRRNYLQQQLESMIGRFAVLEGKPLTFDEESQAIYDALSPKFPEDHFKSILAELDAALPGSGTVQERYDAFRKQFIVPPAKVDAVFRKAVDGCREKTMAHIELPEGESFEIEYVTDKPWSGYNWYKGNYKSLIQVNTSLPIYIDRAVDLACHEGYPGHHVYNLLLEKNLVNERGWKEFTIYPLFSSQSLIAEGTANYGIAMAFPGDERVAWEKEHLFPLAGLDASKAEHYYKVFELREKLKYAGNVAAQRYLDGEAGPDATQQWLQTYSLMTPELAKQRIDFITKYRSYVINYNLGKDLVAKHIESVAGDDEAKRWEVFTELLSTPILPSSLETKN
jgi:hypothetical protein